MSDVLSKKTHNYTRRCRSIAKVHYDILPVEEMARPLAMPTAAEVQAYRRQVAGHTDGSDSKYLGLLQCSNGRVLKPIIKEAQRREIEFYNRVSTATEPDLVELRQCIPTYYGCTKFTYQGYTQDYIVLEDLTVKMLEPCVMDVKIGRRTWDPLATPEKIKSEQSKYALCKYQYGFCIPGFQVVRVETGHLCRYNKEYGKKLHGEAVKEAIRTFLNGSHGSPLCRVLLLQLVSGAWRVQRWARRQTRARLYACSLLVAYDAADLRACCGDKTCSPSPAAPAACRAPPAAPARRRSLHSILPEAGTSLSGLLTSTGPAYKKLSPVSLTPMSLTRQTFSPPPPLPPSPWSKALDHLSHNHSFDHNYEDNLSKMKMDYRAILERLCSDSPHPHPWATVKLIDFAHAFFDDEETTVDDNFREGIDNFVEILEGFLRETDEQAPFV